MHDIRASFGMSLRYMSTFHDKRRTYKHMSRTHTHTHTHTHTRAAILHVYVKQSDEIELHVNDEMI